MMHWPKLCPRCGKQTCPAVLTEGAKSCPLAPPPPPRKPEVGMQFHLRCGDLIVAAELTAIGADTLTFQIAGRAEPITLPNSACTGIDWYGEEQKSA